MVATNITFDTLSYSNELKKNGFTDKQADAITKATSIAFNQIINSENLATKKDILELKDLINSTVIKTITGMSVVQGMIIAFYQCVLHL